MREKLQQSFGPSVLEIEDESHKHAHHAAMKDKEAVESHFKVVVVSDVFKEIALIERHRAVNECLEWELREGGVHALSIQAKTPE